MIKYSLAAIALAVAFRVGNQSGDHPSIVALAIGLAMIAIDAALTARTRRSRFTRWIILGWLAFALVAAWELGVVVAWMSREVQDPVSPTVWIDADMARGERS